MDKYIFILVLFGTSLFGVRVVAACNTTPYEKFLGVIIWAVSVWVLFASALMGDVP